MSLQKRLQYFLMCITGLLCAALGAAAVANTGSAFPGLNRISVTAIQAMLAVQTFVLFAFMSGKRAQAQKTKLCPSVMFILMAAVETILLICVGSEPFTDSFDNIDTAYSMLRNGKVTADNKYFPVLSLWENNYLLSVILMVVFGICKVLGIGDVLTVLYILNAVVMMLSAFIMYKTVSTGVSRDAASRALALTALNPLFYLLTFWIYSVTFSMPFMMLIPYCAIRVKKSERTRCGISWAAAAGLCAVIGYSIRPTAVFPLIALAFTLPAFIAGNKNNMKRTAAVTAAFVIAAACALGGVSAVKDHYYRDIKYRNLPITYWLTMGSHGNGSIDGSAPEAALLDAYYLPEEVRERNELLTDMMTDNYRSLGLTGTLRLFAKKAVTTWANGYSNASILIQSGRIGALYELLAGSRNSIFAMYCNAYRALTLIGMAVFCLRIPIRRKMHGLGFVSALTVFGGIVFYMLWEAKAIYSSAFILIMAYPAAEGLNAVHGLLRSDSGRSGKISFALYSAAVAAMCVVFVFLFARTGDHTDMRIYTTPINRRNTGIENAIEIRQDFCVSDSFNNIILKRMSGGDDPSVYGITLTDADGNTVLHTETNEDNTAEGGVTLEFDTLPSGKYSLELIKEQPDMDDMVFVTKDTYFLDSYPGELYLDGTLKTADLIMNVCLREKSTRYLPENAAAAWIAVYLIISICPAYALLPRRKLCGAETGT